MTIQNLGERLLKIICYCTTHTGEINGLPVKCNSLIRKVVVETGVCRDVGTTVSVFCCCLVSLSSISSISFFV